MTNTQNFSKQRLSPDSSIVAVSQIANYGISIVKSSFDGHRKWAYQLPTSPSHVYDIEVLNNGDVVVMFTMEAPTGAIRYWIHWLKLSASGEVIWTKSTTSYQDYRPSVMHWDGGFLHVAGHIYQSDTQIFYMKLDTAINVVAYDSRKAENKDEINAMTIFQNWVILGGTHEFGSEKGPLFIALDPGGNIRYFYYLTNPVNGAIKKLIGTSDSVIAITNNAIITFDRPVARICNLYHFNQSDEIQLKDVFGFENGRFYVAGSLRNSPGFVQSPLLIRFEEGMKLSEAKVYRDHDLTQFFTFGDVAPSGNIVLGGNRQMNHYYATTVMHTDSMGNTVCEPSDTSFQFKQFKEGIFTYVPSSMVVWPTIGTTAVNLTPLDIHRIVNCLPVAPTADFSLVNDTICQNECIQIVNSSIAGAEFEWTFTGATQNSSTSPSPARICFLEDGTHTITLKAKNAIGVDSTSRTVFVRSLAECEDYIYIPNSFSPNGDGINEVFDLRHNLNTDIKLSIYSTYGELLHEEQRFFPEWDGKYRGAICQVGWYTYLIEYTDSTGKTVKHQGTVYLMDKE